MLLRVNARGVSNRGWLTVKEGLVYVPEDVEVKLRILKNMHDGTLGKAFGSGEDVGFGDEGLYAAGA